MPAKQLPELIAAAKMSLPQLAVAVNEDPDLLRNVVAGRQPIPSTTAAKIAIVLGLQLGEVLASVPSFTAGDAIEDHTARPVDPTLGETTSHSPIAATVQPPPVPAGVPTRLWVVGAGLGAAGAPGARRVFIHDGTVDLQATFNAGATSPHELAVDSTTSRMWSFGGGSRAERFNYQTGASEISISDAGYSTPTFCAALDGSIWVSNQGNNHVERVNPFSGIPQATIPLFVGVAFTPRAMVAQGGKLHVVGAGSDGKWRLFRIDPATNTVEASSTAAIAGDAWGVAYDPDGKRFWVSSQATPAAIFSVDAVTYATTAHPVIGTPPTSPRQLHYAFGTLWVADEKLPDAFPRLIEVDPDTLVAIGVREFGAAAGHLGHVTDDGAFIWCALPSAGEVHKIASNAIATTFLTVTVGGTPEGLLLTT